MLAWVHQVVAAEREFVESLFGANARRMVGAVRNFGETEEEDWMRELMDGSVAKLCGPLKVSAVISHAIVIA
jgi:conserved oligomeric Golgi complex subunit 6